MNKFNKVITWSESINEFLKKQFIINKHTNINGRGLDVKAMFGWSKKDVFQQKEKWGEEVKQEKEIVEWLKI